MKYPKFQLFTGKDNQFYYRLCARNGQVILTGEGYTTKRACQNGISSVQENAPNDDRYQRKTAADGQFYFTLTAANGEPIGNSETYTTERRREDGIQSVKRTAPDAPTEDIT
jgi:uncharacterized protein YegP (UPF0339 family)